MEPDIKATLHYVILVAIPVVFSIISKYDFIHMALGILLFSSCTTVYYVLRYLYKTEERSKKEQRRQSEYSDQGCSPINPRHEAPEFEDLRMEGRHDK